MYTKGTKGGSKALKSFLTYLEDSKDANVIDDATNEMSDYVHTIKHNQEIGGRYMTLGNLMDKIAAEAAEEAVIEATKELSSKLDSANEKIVQKDDEIAQKDDEIAQKDNEIAQKDDEIAQLKKRISELENK